jgi:hypothetical protein
VPRVEIIFVLRPIGGIGDGFWIFRNRPPEIRNKTVLVVDRFRHLLGIESGTSKKHGARPEKRLDVVADVRAKALPDKIGHA